MSANKARLLGPLAIIAVLLASVFAPRPAHPGLWLETLFEWLHVPVFGLISLAILSLCPKSWRTWQRFALAFFSAVFLGVLTEAVQIPMPRDASWEDIIADGTGAAGFLLAAFARRRKPAIAILSVLAGFALLTGSAWPVIAATQAIVHRDNQFPVIFNGDIDSESAFVSARDVRMEARQDASLGTIYTGVDVTGGDALGVEIRDLVPDWTGYSVLNLDLGVENGQSMEVTVRVHDRFHRRGDQPHNDRFNRRFSLPAGHSTLRIPLVDIENAPIGRKMDMTDIEALVIFSGIVEKDRTLRLYEIRLD